MPLICSLAALVCSELWLHFLPHLLLLDLHPLKSRHTCLARLLHNRTAGTNLHQDSSSTPPHLIGCLSLRLAGWAPLAKEDTLPNLGTLWRGEGLHLVMCLVGGAQQHAMRLDAAHVARLQVAQHNDRAILHRQAEGDWLMLTVLCLTTYDGAADTSYVSTSLFPRSEAWKLASCMFRRQSCHWPNMADC